MSYETTWLLAGLSVYVFFPVAQLSILESASLTNPLSKPILASLRNQFLLWCTFYIMALFIALAVAIALFSARLNHPPAMFVARGIFLVAAGFLYFRLLGRLAWACQMSPLRETSSRDDTTDSQSSPSPPDSPPSPRTRGSRGRFAQ